MRLEMDGRFVRVTLSRRNLTALLAKLEGFPVDSKRTLTYQTTIQGSGGNLELSVIAEEDVEHYAHPERDVPLPGPMHPETEAAL